MNKQYSIPAEQIKQLLPPNSGGCIATDQITVDGKPIKYMYRERTSGKNPADTGWRFFSGEETQEYIDDPNHSGVYSLNTIANYDPKIIPLLGSDYDTAFELNPDTGEFEEVEE